MNRYTRNLGLAMVCLGALLLLLGYTFGWTDSNAMLVVAVVFVVAGAGVHVFLVKRESKY